MKKLYFVIIMLLISISLFAQDKPDALASYRNGRSLDSAGKYAEADLAYQESVNICKQELIDKPANLDSYVVMGWSLIKLDQFAETDRICNEALKINPLEYRVIETQAEAKFYLAQYQNSLKLFEQYLNANPRGDRTSTAFFFVGEIYKVMGKREHAEIAYSAAVQIEPSMALWWVRLAQMRELTGKKESAKIAYEKALNLSPNYKEAQDGLKRVL